MFQKHILKYAKGDAVILFTEKDTFADISKQDIRKLIYHKIASEDQWKIDFIREITEVN